MFLQQSIPYRKSFVQVNVAWTQIIYSVNKIKVLLTRNNADIIYKMWFSVIITIYTQFGLFIIKIELKTTK